MVLLDRELVAFFASRTAPPETLELASRWAHNIARTNKVVISCFHSPIERTVLDVLLAEDCSVVVFTFLFIDMFDTIGILVGVCTKANIIEPNGRIPRIKEAFMLDAIATTVGACIGTSTTTTYVESASGVAQGGRTGLTPFAVAVCFAISLFFSSIFLAIPAAATAPVLVIVGLFMMSPIKNIPFDDYAESIPAFITIVMMPLVYSISDGILLGMISYVVLNALCGNFKRITPAMYVLAVLFILKYIFI